MSSLEKRDWCRRRIEDKIRPQFQVFPSSLRFTAASGCGSGTIRAPRQIWTILDHIVILSFFDKNQLTNGINWHILAP